MICYRVRVLQKSLNYPTYTRWAGKPLWHLPLVKSKISSSKNYTKSVRIHTNPEPRLRVGSAVVGGLVQIDRIVLKFFEKIISDLSQ